MKRIEGLVCVGETENNFKILDEERRKKAIENISEEAVKFLYESNLIEAEESTEALEDSVVAWYYANTNRLDEINSDYVKNIQFFLMRRLNPRIAGRFRVSYCTVEGKHDTAYPKDIDELMKKWCEEFNETKNLEDEIKEEHIQFMKIHPFADGNGRTGRILFNIQRLNSKYQGLHLFLRVNRSARKGEDNYYGWFD